MSYPYLDYYWTKDKRWAYFILVDGKLAGFAMVIDLPEADDRECDFQMVKFFKGDFVVQCAPTGVCDLWINHSLPED